MERGDGSGFPEKQNTGTENRPRVQTGLRTARDQRSGAGREGTMVTGQGYPWEWI